MKKLTETEIEQLNLELSSVRKKYLKLIDKYNDLVNTHKLEMDAHAVITKEYKKQRETRDERIVALSTHVNELQGQIEELKKK
jgi:hypothetical protein